MIVSMSASVFLCAHVHIGTNVNHMHVHAHVQVALLLHPTPTCIDQCKTKLKIMLRIPVNCFQFVARKTVINKWLSLFATEDMQAGQRCMLHPGNKILAIGRALGHYEFID